MPANSASLDDDHHVCGHLSDLLSDMSRGGTMTVTTTETQSSSCPTCPETPSPCVSLLHLWIPEPCGREPIATIQPLRVKTWSLSTDSQQTATTITSVVTSVSTSVVTSCGPTTPCVPSTVYATTTLPGLTTTVPGPTTTASLPVPRIVILGIFLMSSR